jgi:hypothetical protein
MSRLARHPSVQRDLSLQRLRDLTFVTAAGAAGLLGVFSIVAATTVPGHSDGGATASTGTTQSSSTSTDPTYLGGDDLQPPVQAPFPQPVATAPHVVSGGSR